MKDNNELSHFFYLKEKHFKRLTNFISTDIKNRNIYTKPIFLHLAAQLEVIGFSIEGVHLPYIGRTTKKNDSLFDYSLEAYIDFTTNGKPQEKYQNEYTLVKKILMKNGYNNFHPYLSWATEEGEVVRNEIEKELQKQKLTEEYIQWRKIHNKKKRLFGKLVEELQRETKIKLHFSYDEEREIFTIYNNKKKKDTSRFSMTKEEKLSIATQYEREFRVLRDYLNKVFSKKKF